MSSLKTFIKIKEAEFEENYPTEDLGVMERYLLKTGKDFWINVLHQYDTLKKNEIEGLREENKKNPQIISGLYPDDEMWNSGYLTGVDDVLKVFKGE